MDDNEAREIPPNPRVGIQPVTRLNDPRSAPGYLEALPQSTFRNRLLTHSSMPDPTSMYLRLLLQQSVASSVSYQTLSLAESRPIQNSELALGRLHGTSERYATNKTHVSPVFTVSPLSPTTRSQPITIGHGYAAYEVSPESFAALIFTRPQHEESTPHTDAASWVDYITPTQRHLNQFAFPAPDGDPPRKEQGAEEAMTASFPPRVVNPATRTVEFEFLPAAPRRTGIDAWPLVVYNEMACRKFIDYAKKENASRLQIYGPAHMQSAEYHQLKMQITDLSGERSRRRPRISGPKYKVLKDKFRGQLAPLKGTLTSLAIELWFRKMERDALITEVFQWEPFGDAIVIRQPEPPYIPKEKPKALPRDPFNESIRDPEEPSPVRRPPASADNPVGLTFMGTAFEHLATRKEEEEEPPPELGPSKWETLMVPEWFGLLEDKECLLLLEEGHRQRYNELVNILWQLEKNLEHEKITPQANKKKDWDKQFHDADPRWEKPWQQKRGGWWKCRSEPGAPQIERDCVACHSPAPDLDENEGESKLPTVLPIGHYENLPNTTDWSTQAQYDWIWTQIDLCQGVIGNRDKRKALAQRRLERKDVDALMQYPNWKWRAGFCDNPAWQMPRLRGPFQNKRKILRLEIDSDTSDNP